LYDAPEGSTLPAHHGNVTQMDHAFGRLMSALDESGHRDDTLAWIPIRRIRLKI
jgi:arylsulfatase A